MGTLIRNRKWRHGCCLFYSEPLCPSQLGLTYQVVDIWLSGPTSKFHRLHSTAHHSTGDSAVDVDRLQTSKIEVLSTPHSKSEIQTATVVDFSKRTGPVFTQSPCKPVGMLDINLFRTDKGVPKTEIVCESQRRGLADVSLVDQVTLLYKQWRTSKYELDQTRKGKNALNKKIKLLKLRNLDATEATKESEDFKKEIAAKEVEVKSMDARLSLIGNLVHDSVPMSNDEANDSVLRTWGECKQKGKLIDHLELVNRLQIADLVKGSEVAGGGGYYLERGGALLNAALVDFGETINHFNPFFS